MKRNILLLIFTWFFIFTLSSAPAKQIEKVVFSYTIDGDNKNDETSYSLNLSIDNNNPVDIYLYESQPNPENLVFEKEKTSKEEIQIKKLSAGEYTIIIYEGDNKATIEKILIGNSKND